MTMDIASSQNNHGTEYIKMPSPKISEEQTNGDDQQHQLHHNHHSHHKLSHFDNGPIEMTTTPSAKNAIKRSFDVAFLMMPDEKFKQKTHLEKQAKIEEEIDVTTFNEDPSDFPKNFHQSRMLQQEIARAGARFPLIQNHRAPRIYDDPTIHIPNAQAMKNNFTDLETPKSAFTKVPHTRLDSPIPPSSPDQLSCPSNSPPISLSPPRTIYNNNIRPEYFGGAFQPIQNLTQAQKLKQQFIYRPPNNCGNGELPPGYMPQTTSFTFNGSGHPFSQQSDITGIVRHPAAAAILSTLIPPAIASTFSLTAQNVCAKCNINFRMTSDLVYHMRSHHKSETTSDYTRRKREEKLKCPVCSESFRERHHLTRHMTAHQDKEGDDTEGISIELGRRHHKQHQ